MGSLWFRLLNVWTSVVGLWVVWCALLGGAGWLLSAVGQLNRGGYAVVLSLGTLLLAWAWARESVARRPRRTLWRTAWVQWRRRRRRVVPMLFLSLAALVLLSGLLHAPNNYDGLSYRTPRLLHWLAAGQWHWVEVLDWRLNNRGAGFEWASAPLIVFTGTERAIFLLNVISYWLLPGLIFGIFTRLGVRRQVAWWWMWLLPTGYCFALQAGGSANDLFSVPLAFAAVDLALRARQSGRVSQVWLSLLAAATLTSVKATNLPLLLPCALALLPSLRLLWSHKLATAGVLLLGTLSSFLPTAFFNQKYCGDWSGAILDKTAGSPGVVGGVVGNSFLLLSQNFTPTFFPWAGRWNASAPELLPRWVWKSLSESFERHAWYVGELPIEETAGPGFGLAVLGVAGSLWLLWRRWSGGRSAGHRRSPIWQLAVVAAPWISFLVVISTLAIGGVSRVLAPYFPLLLVVWLRPGGQAALVRCRWWRGLAGAMAALAVLAVAVTPSRPLWPARTVLGRVQAKFPNHAMIKRAYLVYDVYARRNDALAAVRSFLPTTAREVGLVTDVDDPETSLWRPFGSRRIHQLRPSVTRADLKRRNIEYVILSPAGLSERFQLSLDEWLTRFDAELVGETSIHWRATGTPMTWRVVRLRREGRPAAGAGQEDSKVAGLSAAWTLGSGGAGWTLARQPALAQE